MDDDTSDPPARLIRRPSDAEIVVRDWLRHWGQIDAIRTGGSRDMGIDVESSDYVVQVKATTGPVGRPVVQQMFGIATYRSKRALIFSLGGFTDEALEWATAAQVGLFEFDLQGFPLALNHPAVLSSTSGRSKSDRSDRIQVATLDEASIRLRQWLEDVQGSHLLAIGGSGFCEGLVRSADTDLPRLKTWSFDPAEVSEKDLVDVVLGLEPGDGLVVQSIESLPTELAMALAQSARSREIAVVLGKGASATRVRIELAEFSLIGVSPEPGRMETTLLSMFDTWIIHTDP